MKDAFDAILRPEQAKYLESIETPRDPLLVEMEAYAAANRQPISDPEVASFLAITARAARAKLVVELGTNIGYGAIVLARAAADARVVTIELDPKTAGIARGFIARSEVASRVEVREGDARAELEKIAGGIDLLYVDCVKEHYPRYFELGVPRLAERGVIVADNVLWRGLTAAADADVPESERARVAALRAFNRSIVSDPRLRGVILPLGDGVAYATRVS